MKAIVKSGQSFGKSRAGMTAGESGGVLFLRGKSTPKNVNTSRMSGKRVQFANVVTTWHQVPAGERVEWREQQSPGTSGTSKFAGLNVNRREVGEAIITDAPIIVQPPAFTFTVLMEHVAGDDNVVLLTLPSVSYTGMTLFVRAAGLLPASKESVPLFETVPIVSVFEPSPGAMDVTAAYESVWGDLIEALFTERRGVSWAARLMHVPSGRATEWLRFFTTVVDV